MQTSNVNIKVRFPPSPTGYCHVGTARMGILNYLFAKKNGGTIVYRSEDTDKERSRAEFEQDIIEQLHWLGLSWDEFYRQSERTGLYRGAIEKLIAEGKAFISQEASKKEEGKRVQVIRLKNPGSKITFTDLIRGDITFDTAELKDFAIARAVDDPLYHLAVVVDDAAMGITHVLRGEDHISNTPRQILIQEALGLPRPAYAHYPLHLSPERAKLSKRMGDVAVRDYREKGYVPEALLNYLAVLGWTPPSQREILSLSEMIEEFDIRDLHKSGAIFDVEKLNWFNREYIKKMSMTEFADYCMPVLKREFEARNIPWNREAGERLIFVLKGATNTSKDLEEAVQKGEYDYVFVDPRPQAVHIPDKKSNKEEALKHLEYIRSVLEPIPAGERFNQVHLLDTVWIYATENGRGAVLWPLRYVLTGREKSPSPFVVADVIGKEATIRRIDTAIGILEGV